MPGSSGQGRPPPASAAQVEVREAAAGEYPAVAELTVVAYKGLGGELGPYERTLRDVAGRAASADVLVAVAGGRVVGAVTYVSGPESGSAEFADPEAAGIRFLAVDPAAQGQGIGTRLLAVCLDRARAAGKARVLLHTTARMPTAIRMYEREGFVREPALDIRLERGIHLLGYRRELAGGGTVKG